MVGLNQQSVIPRVSETQMPRKYMIINLREESKRRNEKIVSTT